MSIQLLGRPFAMPHQALRPVASVEEPEWPALDITYQSVSDGIELWTYTSEYINAPADVGGTRYNVHVIKPSGWSSEGSYPLLIALPATPAGTEGGIPALFKPYADLYGCVIIIPYEKTTVPWWGCFEDGTRNGHDFVARQLTIWARSALAIGSGRENVFVIGYSKSAHAAYSLILRNPDVFGYAGGWDSPWNASHSTAVGYGADFYYDTEAQWNLYNPIGILAANVAAVNDKARLVLHGQYEFPSDLTAMKSALDANSVLYDFSSVGAPAHNFSSGWLPRAMAGLFSLKAPVLPLAFTTGQWGASPGDNKITIAVHSLPFNGGASITDIEYRINGGSPVSSGGVVGFEITGRTNGVEDSVQVRPVTSAGAGPWSDTKAVTPAAPGFWSAEVQAKQLCWLDVADGATLFQTTDTSTPITTPGSHTGGRVSDKSGNNRHALQSSSGSRPLYEDSGGVPRLIFDGSNDHLLIASAGFPTNNDIEIFFVGIPSVGNGDKFGDNSILHFAPASGDRAVTGSLWINPLKNGSTRQIQLRGSSSTSLTATHTATAINALTLIEARVNGTVATVDSDQGSAATDSSFTALTAHSGALIIGGQFFFAISGYLDIALCELFITTGLTTDERAEVISKLATKWGL